MTQRLRDDPDSLNALVTLTAEARGIDAAFVEEDFWVIEVLRAATLGRFVASKDGQDHAVRTIFKGGTSLSRVYGLIERFSEDVDLLVAFPDADVSKNARDKLLKAIRDRVSDHLETPFEAVTATTGVKRNVRYGYPAQHGSSVMTTGILLEMGSRGGTFPTQQHAIRSLAAIHAIESLGEDVEAWDEFQPVEVEVLAPERTLFEKLALLHDSATRFPQEAARTKLLTGGRHLYDVHCLLNSSDVISALAVLGPVGVSELCADIDRHSASAEFSFTPRPSRGFGASPIVDSDPIRLEVSRQGYMSAMELVYGERPGFDECVETIRARADML